jgi:hypothetical protein
MIQPIIQQQAQRDSLVTMNTAVCTRPTSCRRFKLYIKLKLKDCIRIQWCLSVCAAAPLNQPLSALRRGMMMDHQVEEYVAVCTDVAISSTGDSAKTVGQACQV